MGNDDQSKALGKADENGKKFLIKSLGGDTARCFDIDLLFLEKIEERINKPPKHCGQPKAITLNVWNAASAS